LSTPSLGLENGALCTREIFFIVLRKVRILINK